MPISFSTSKSTSGHNIMYSPNGAQSIGELPDFDDIKQVDLEVGASVGAIPLVKRTWIDPSTHTYLHGEVGVLAMLKFNRTKEG